MQQIDYSPAPPLHLERLVGFQQLTVGKQVFELGKPRVALEVFEDMAYY